MHAVSPFDSSLFSQLLSDTETASRMGDKSQLRSMLQVEGALALAQADAGLIPVTTATAIARAADDLHPEPSQLAAATARAGVPVPALVKLLRQALPDEHAKWVHFGATSQDIIDTAMILNLRDELTYQRDKLRIIIGSLADLAEQHRQTPIAGRTRTQQGVPMSFGLKIAQWLLPLLRQLDRLAELKPRLLRIQLGGAVGTLSAMGEKAGEINRRLAERLNLGDGPCWHTQRDNLVELSGWLGMTTGALGKMAQDWLWLSQSEVAEIRFTNGGGSSTMPQKCNPVNAEIIVAMARTCGAGVGQMHQAQLQEHERSGSAWTQEWFALPQQLMAASVALKHAKEALKAILVDEQRMSDNLECHYGVIFSEAATFELLKTLSRNKAETVVKQAVVDALATHTHLLHILNERTGLDLSSERLKTQIIEAGASTQWLDSILDKAKLRNTAS